MYKRNFTVDVFSNIFVCSIRTTICQSSDSIFCSQTFSSKFQAPFFYSTMFYRIVAALAASTCVESQITVANDVDQFTQVCVDRFCSQTLSRNTRRQCQHVYDFTCRHEWHRHSITVESQITAESQILDHIGGQCAQSCIETLTKCYSRGVIIPGPCDHAHSTCLDACQFRSQDYGNHDVGATKFSYLSKLKFVYKQNL